MINWLLFVLISISVTIALYVPGLLSFARFDLPNHLLVALSPAFSILILSAAMLLFYVLNCPVPWYFYLVFLVLISAAMGFCNRKTILNRVRSASLRSCGYMTVYILISFVLVSWIYLKNLDGPSSVIPYFDNAFALSTVRCFSNTRLHGVVFSSCYGDTPVLFDGVRYYPTCMHSLAALIVEAFNVSPSESLNIIIFVCLCPVLCLSVRSLIRTCYPDDLVAEFIGCFISYGFVGFPWGLITFGSLLANLFSLVFVPATISSGIILSRRILDNRNGSISSALASFAILMVLLALTHPGSLFTTGVILVPLILKTINNYLSSVKIISAITRKLIVLVSLFAVAGIWVISFNLPALHDTVSFNWPAFQSLGMALSSLLTLSFADFPSQVTMSVIVMIAMASCFRKQEENNWLLISAAFACILYIVDVTTDGYFKQLLTGFWYTDSRRIVAIVVICLIPFSARGLSIIFKWSNSFIANKSDSRVSPFCYSFCCILLVLFSVFGPSLIVNGSFTLTSPFSYLRNTISSINELRGKPFVDGRVETLMLDKAEMEAGPRLKDVIDDRFVVFNNPLDGSSFLYGLNDINLFYRLSSAQDGTDKSNLLRSHIDEYATNAQVKSEVIKYGIRYVLQLDYGLMPSGSSSFYCVYSPEYWSGVQSIDDSTQGFKLIYSHEDIRLYELTEI